jgi:tRNA C32,U32 (ribose-2'-O)-methylase TrmJ
MTIPTNPEFDSMNLAHAVAIVAYEIREQLSAQPVGRTLERPDLEQVEGFHQRLAAMLGRNWLPQSAEPPTSDVYVATNDIEGLSRRKRCEYSAGDSTAMELVLGKIEEARVTV